MKNLVRVHPVVPELALIERAAAVLRDGGLVAFPTETVYGLGAHALNADAVRNIFAAKGRPDWDPLIVHVNGPQQAQALAQSLPLVFHDLANRFWPGPLTLVVPKSPQVPDEVTARRASIALRMPRHPVIGALLAVSGLPLAAPSANRFGRPSPTTAEHVAQDLGERVDLILDAGPTPLGVESTVLDLTQTPPAILRPGEITRELIEAVIGPVTVAGPVAGPERAAGLVSPGMTYRHYSPTAAVELFDSPRELQERAAALRAANRRIAMLEQNGNLDTLAHTLYAQLRRFDGDEVEFILCVLPPAHGFGMAIRDRLLRAAGRGNEQ